MYSLQKPTSTQYRELLVPRWELNHPHGHAVLGTHNNSSPSGGSNRSARSRLSSLTPSGQSVSAVFWFIKLHWQETSQPAFAIYVCSPWRAYLQKIQVTSGEALDRVMWKKGRLFTWISNRCLTYQEDWKVIPSGSCNKPIFWKRDFIFSF